MGGEGKNLEAEVLRIRDEYGMRIIGPNCVGTVGLHSGFNSTFYQWSARYRPDRFVFRNPVRSAAAWWIM